MILDYDFPETVDVRDSDCLKLMLSSTVEKGFWLDVTMYPLKIARPEFIEKTRATVFVAPGSREEVEIPFSLFDYRHSFDAHLKYIDQVELDVRDAQVRVTNLRFGRAGNFQVEAPKTTLVGLAGEVRELPVLLINERDQDCFVTVGTEQHGKETARLTVEELIVLKPREQRRIMVSAVIPGEIAVGGREVHTLCFVPDNEAGRMKKVDFYVARKGRHPFILHHEEGFERIRQAVQDDVVLRKGFIEKYLNNALAWEVPEPAEDERYVYYSPTQWAFLATAIAWKISGQECLKKKVLNYLEGFMDEERGYLKTRQSYFVFIESPQEYCKGDFKVHRGCSMGWIQEAEFMTKIAIVYDLLYNEPEFTPRMHAQMEACMRAYMDFAGWRLGDGDGNNFQLAEAAAGLRFAMILQDYAWIERFLDGPNGLKDLMGSVLADDGSYFEGASNYIRLVGEILQSIAIAGENFGLNLKDAIVPAAFDTHVIHSPWALRRETAADGKPFLGMSFDKSGPDQKPVRRLKDHFDSILPLLTEDGVLFSANDSNEQDYIAVMEAAYYLYRDSRYQTVTKLAKIPDLLYGKHMIGEPEFVLGQKSVLNTGYGFAVLRDLAVRHRVAVNDENPAAQMVQAVLKFGQHGGYHGHFDRLSLVSLIRGNRNFHNMEYTWFGYDSFLFKMWVQASLSHNMVVADGRMQEPVPAKCIYFADQDNFKAACAQVTSRWCDPPYGGQTPYPYQFPEEKCRRENRYILPAEKKRGQGEIGEYSEPVFQRRLMVLVEDVCFIWDYQQGQKEHTYDCLYHPLGQMQAEGLTETGYRQRFDENPYGAGQFIRGCYLHQGQGTVKMLFHNEKRRENENDLIDFTRYTEVYRIFPAQGEVIIGHYPLKTDTFSPEETKNLADIRQTPAKKTVAFRERGKTARFITALTIGEDPSGIAGIDCRGYDCLAVTKKNGVKYLLKVTGMDNPDEDQVEVCYEYST